MAGIPVARDFGPAIRDWSFAFGKRPMANPYQGSDSEWRFYARRENWRKCERLGCWSGRRIG
jgi:hypothetical protein